jgi:hypothetical protein
LLLTVLFLSPLAAGIELEAQVPDSLKPWIPWVLEGDDRRDCPLATDEGKRLCAWPGRLHLDLDDSGGLFAQRWRVYAQSWVPLPGGPDQWPQDVRLGTDAAAVVQRAGTPAVQLDPGDYAVSGRFLWPGAPDGLAIPPATGLVSLRLDGEQVEFPRFERDGRLWLGAGAKAIGGTERDSLGLEVYRRIEDDNPLRLVTRLDMDVAGRARELTLGPVLLEGGIPLRVDSPLPARLEPDGRLRLQVRPGHWVVEVTAHHPGPVSGLALGALSSPWPDEEVWVFAAHPELRQVELEGAGPVDPRQTRLPPEWARLPAYLIGHGGTLRLVQLRRGDADPAPDRLALERDLWLDFRGTGYTLRDRIAGELTRSWRLEVGDRLDLGQVLVGGDPRFITRLADSPSEGIEVRQGRVDLVADSRIEGEEGRLPASGWSLDFQSLRTRLHLPPGWDLLAVAGVDNLPDSWLNRWTLLDLFLVLIIALAVARLWSWGWGAAALVTMALIWQEPDAPRMIWLNLLGAFALLRLLPEDPARAAMARLRRVLLLYYRGSLVVLAVIALPFLVNEVRTGIYPQLERPWRVLSGTPATTAPEPAGIAEDAPMMDRAEMKAQLRRKAVAPLAAAPPPRPLPVVDPDARVQTGPGLPAWSWKSLDLSWSGPVPRDHQVELWLLAPGWNLALALVRLVLVLLLALKLAGLFGSALRRAPAVAVILLAAGLSGISTPVSAQEIPSPEMLEALKARLLEPPDCLPSCADIPRMELSATGDRLELLLTVDAGEAIALPVPGSTGVWTPTGVTLDGEPLDGLRRGEDGTYLVAVEPGRWRIGLSGPLPPRAQIEIPLPLRPRRVEAWVEGWRLEGTDENARPGPQIRLVRLRTQAGSGELQPAEVPPLLRIRRTLQLGVDWRVRTQVVRLSPPDTPVVLDVPLISGEQVLSEGARVRDGRVLVSLAPGQRSVAWSSSLEPVDGIRLRASEDERLSEEWRVDLSPLWHLETEGIPVVHHLGRLERWLPTWRPWPGEEVLLSLSRPLGVPGPTLTLDESNYLVRPGNRVSEAVLDLTLRSSQGGRHEILLPEGAELRRVAVDGVERPLRLDGRVLALPLAPAALGFRIEWRQPGPLHAFYSPPVPELGTDGVNASVQIELGRDRWILFAGGPPAGPAVLFWGLVIVLVLLAIGLGRSRITPLRTLDWLLLGLGLSQAGIWVGLLVAGWLFALGLRARLDEDLPPWRFNLMQTGLFVLSLAALSALVAALQQGLLGLPEMQIAGNGSTQTRLDWYQDRGGPRLPEVWVVSVPILVYRGLMLAWALWLAFRLLGWLRWGWQGLARPVLWREVRLKLPARKRTAARAASGPESPPVEKDGPDLEFR